MGFRGDLRNVQLADVLQTLAQNQQEGVLTLSNGNAVRRLHFTNAGVALLDPQVANRRRLGEILLRSSMITQEHLDEALREQSRHRRFLGEILIEQGVIEEGDLQHILQVQVEEELYDLFRIMDGTFEFEEGEPDDPPLHQVVPFHVDSVVLEAARRLDEWGMIGREVPSLNRVYVPNEIVEPLEIADPLDEDENATVLQQLDGMRTVQATADSLLASPFVVAKVLSRLKERGRVREASEDEVVAAATSCLNAGNRAQAVQLLESLDPDLMTDPRSLSDLAHLFREADQGARAAQLRARLAAWARQQGDLDEAWRQLREAKKDQPSSVDILLSLIELAQEQQEIEIEVRLLKELAGALSTNGDAEGAVAALERVYELVPADADARRVLVEACLRARQKSRAIELLETEAEELRATDRLPELATTYKRILAIDSRRNDVRKALAKLRRSTAERAVRRVGGLVFALVALVGTSLWLLDRVRRGQAESDLAGAHAMHEAGDLVQARSLLQSILDRYTIDSVNFVAADELREVDEALRQSNLQKRLEMEQAFDVRLVEIEGLAETRQFAAAIQGLVDLVVETKEPFLHDRVEVRLRSTCQAFVQGVARASQQVAEFQAPTTNASAPMALNRMRGLFPANTPEQVEALRALTNAHKAEGGSDSWVEKIEQATTIWNNTFVRLAPQIEVLERRCAHIQKLDLISADHRRADEAITAGNLVDAITLYRKILNTYGEGELRESLEIRLRRLEGAQRIGLEIGDYLSSGQTAKAIELERLSREEYQRHDLLTILKIPIHVVSRPKGAVVELEGQVLGQTPLLVPVGAENAEDLTVRIPGFEPSKITIDSRESLEHEVWLEKRTRLQLSLRARSETGVVWGQRMLFVATRDGTLQGIDPRDPLHPTKFPPPTLIGSRTEPVTTSAGVVHTLSDGRVVLLDAKDGKLEVRWEKDLGFELRFTPQVLGNLVLVSGPQQIVALELASGKVAFQAPLEGHRIAAEPLLVETVLVVPLVGGTFLGWDVVSRTTVFKEVLQDDIVGPMAASGTRVAMVSTEGTLTVLDIARHERLLRLDKGDLPVAPPAWVGDEVWLSYPKHLLRARVGDGLIRTVDFGARPSTQVCATSDGTVLVGSTDGSLYGIDPNTMQTVFRTHVGNRPVAGRPLVVEDFLAVICEDGTLRVFDR